MDEPRPAYDHEGREHWAQLPDERQGNCSAEKSLGAELHQGVIALKPKNHAGEEAYQRDDKNRLDPDEIDLLNDSS